MQNILIKYQIDPNIINIQVLDEEHNDYGLNHWMMFYVQVADHTYKHIKNHPMMITVDSSWNELTTVGVGNIPPSAFDTITGAGFCLLLMKR